MEIIHHELGRDPLYKIWNKSSKNMIIFAYSEGGSFVFQDKIYAMKKGALCFIPSNTYHYTMPETPEKYDRSKIYLSDKYFKKIISLCDIDEDFVKTFSAPAYAIVPEEKVEEIEELFSRASKKQENTSLFLSCYFSIISALKEHSLENQGVVNNSALKDCVSVAINYINNNFSNDITLDDICAKIYTSKYHFCRKFKNAVRMTVMDYIAYTRVVHAKKLLKEGQLNISEISEKCGFSSVSYFCQIFKRLTGVTAKEYKKRN